MIKYSKNKNNQFYVQIDSKIYIVGMKGISTLKKISFNITCWKYFKKLVFKKQMKMLEIAENIFGEERNIELEKAIWIMMEMLMQENNKGVKEYFEYHAKLCFSQYWIHRYAYFEYHGFDLTKGMFFRTKLDRIETLPENVQYHLSNIIDFGIKDVSLPLRIYPQTRYDLKININNNGWKNISLDARNNFKLEKNVKKTKQLLATIQKQLLNHNSLSTITENFEVEAGIIIMYAIAIHPKLFNNSIKKTMRNQMLNNEEISLSKAIQFHIVQDTNLLNKVKKYHPKAYEELRKIVFKYQETQVKHFDVFNRIVVSEVFKKYTIGYIKQNIWRTFTISLGIISDTSVARDIKEFAIYSASKGVSVEGEILSFFKYVKTRKKSLNLKASDIEYDDIVAWFDKRSKDKKLKGVKNTISSFYKYLINKAILEGSISTDKLKAIQKTLSSEIIIVDNKEESTLPLPEEVYLQIRHHIDEVSVDVKNAFLIISSTGCRPSELASINQNSLIFDQKLNCHILVLNIEKQAKAYAKKGKEAIRKIPLYDNDVIKAIENQILISKDIRKEAKIDSIFVRKSLNYAHQVKYHIISSKELIREISGLIKKYDIRADIDNELWHYTPYQMRAMIATTMVEEGYNPEEIKSFFGWLTLNTSEKAYAYVRTKKAEELNTDFFREHFKIQFNNNLLSGYSKKDKEQMFVELYIHKRQMEYGECVRHPIMGECGKLQTADSCANCARLITDSKYLSSWQRLRDNQESILNAFIEKAESEGCPKSEYETWSEYIIQKNRLDAYESLIDRLIESSKEKECQH